MTKRSIHLIKEYRNYMWKIDKDGKQLRIPEGGNDHLLDCARYGLESYFRHTDSFVGLVDATPRPDKIESFIVNEDGDAEAFHINLGEVAKRSQEEEWYQ